MKRSELEHIIRAAGAITLRDDFVIIGSQAILGQFPDAPAELLKSLEADIFPRDCPEEGELIDGAIGEESSFHETFGYYAHGVADDTATLPRGWQDRLIRVEGPATGGATGWCLEIHDLAISKLVAGREQDREYVGALLRHELVDATLIARRLDETELDPALRELCEKRWQAIRRLQ